jgi:hypothetical protein
MLSYFPLESKLPAKKDIWCQKDLWTHIACIIKRMNVKMKSLKHQIKMRSWSSLGQLSAMNTDFVISWFT